LVHHFYGSKEQLFATAMRLPVNPREVLEAALAPEARRPGESLGEHLLRTVLGIWEVAEIRDTFLGLLRSAPTSEQAVVMLRALPRPVAPGGPGARPAGGGGARGIRGALVPRRGAGRGPTGYGGEIPAVGKGRSDDLISAIAPNLDRYLSGDLH